MANPAIEVVRAVKRCVADEWQIPVEQGKVFQLIEHENGQELQVSVSGMADIVCLDIDKKRVRMEDGSVAKDPTLPFFEPGEAGILKKNDAILLCSSDERLFVFLVELKQKNTGDYRLQLESGKRFVQYVLSVLELHGKCAVVAPDFFGVVCFGTAHSEVRKSATKMPSQRSSAYGFTDRLGTVACNCYDQEVRLQDWINAAKRVV